MCTPCTCMCPDSMSWLTHPAQCGARQRLSLVNQVHRANALLTSRPLFENPAVAVQIELQRPTQILDQQAAMTPPTNPQARAGAKAKVLPRVVMGVAVRAQRGYPLAVWLQVAAVVVVQAGGDVADEISVEITLP